MATLKVLAIIGLIVILLLTFTSCESKSGKIPTTTPEKVMIIDSELKLNEQGHYEYKVKRLEKGVVAYISSVYLYEAGDTILYRFPNYGTN